MALFDSKAETFNRPFTVPQIAVALRELRGAPGDSIPVILFCMILVGLTIRLAFLRSLRFP